MIELKYKNFIFDCDSTLTKIEGLEELVTDFLKEEITKITEQGMNGEITFSESLNKRLNIIRPSLNDFKMLGNKYIETQTEGAKTLITLIKYFGGNVYIVSGGPKVSLNIFGNYLGIPEAAIFGTEIDFDTTGNYLQINPNSLLAKDNSKAVVAKKIKESGPTVMIGDGFNDLVAAKVCDQFIGFGGVKDREVMRKNCENYYTQSNLLGLVDYFCSINVNIKEVYA